MADSRERSIFETTPAEDAGNFKELWIATVRERDTLAYENARLREAIAQLRKPKLVYQCICGEINAQHCLIHGVEP